MHSHCVLLKLQKLIIIVYFYKRETSSDYTCMGRFDIFFSNIEFNKILHCMRNTPSIRCRRQWGPGSRLLRFEISCYFNFILLEAPIKGKVRKQMKLVNSCNNGKNSRPPLLHQFNPKVTKYSRQAGHRKLIANKIHVELSNKIYQRINPKKKKSFQKFFSNWIPKKIN